MAEKFKAFVVDKIGDQMTSGVRDITTDDLPEREVIIRVDYSSVNYKDGLAHHRQGADPQDLSDRPRCRLCRRRRVVRGR